MSLSQQEIEALAITDDKSTVNGCCAVSEFAIRRDCLESPSLDILSLVAYYAVDIITFNHSVALGLVRARLVQVVSLRWMFELRQLFEKEIDQCIWVIIRWLHQHIKMHE